MKFLRLLLQSLGFTLFLICLFVCIRVVFILYVGFIEGHLREFNVVEIFQVLIDGAKYDNRAVAVMGLVYFLLGFIFLFFKFQNKILSSYVVVMFILSLALSIINMGFYNVFNSAFDNNLLGLFNDDQIAIFKVLVSGEYYLIAKIIALVVSTFICFYIYKKIVALVEAIVSAKIFISFHRSFSCGFFLVFLGLSMVLTTSQFHYLSVSLDQRVRPAKDHFLRNITPGAFRDLWNVYKFYKQSKKFDFSSYSSQTPLETAKNFFNLPANIQTPLDLSILLQHVSANTSPVKINHIFYIVSESLSEWYFDKDFDEIGLVSGLKSLVDNKHGFKLTNFIENGENTIQSLNTHITGCFEIGIHPNRIHLTSAFPTATASIFHQLGYATRFYYGGSGTWKKLDSYTKSQGFDKIFYNLHLLDYAKDKRYQPVIESGWGVYDNVLFDYIRQNTLDLSKPSFNMVMTTSVHAPHDVDLRYFNVPMKEIQTFLKTKFPKSSMEANILGHVWWYDKEVTRFIKEVSRVLPDSLFVITGDHYGRSYISPPLNNRVFKSIPLVLYSPLLSPKKLSDIGSHIDITPTIVELVAPKGFSYPSFGNPIFSNDHSRQFEPDRYALGYYVVGTHRFLYTPERKIEYINAAKPQDEDEEYALKLYKKLQQAQAMSWWLMNKGNVIK